MFYSTVGTKDTLLKRISPDANQLAFQTEAWNDLADFIINNIDQTLETWIQGSYKFGTQIRPSFNGSFDIDLGIYFVRSSTDIDYSNARKSVTELLKKYINKTNYRCTSVEEKPSCLRLKYDSGFHIDLPIYIKIRDTGETFLAKEGEGWQQSDPKEIYLWFRGSVQSDDLPTLKRVVKYLKAWAQVKTSNDFQKPSSILLSALAANSWESSEGPDEILFAKSIQRIHEQYYKDKSVPNPAGVVDEPLNRLDDDSQLHFEQNLDFLLGCANKYLESEDIFVWESVFEHLMPVDMIFENSSDTKLPALHADIDVSVSWSQSPKSPTRMPERESYNKGWRLFFRVNNPNSFPPGTQFMWTVRNNGKEAQEINDLGHVSTSGLNCEEGTAYNGTHFMDCRAVLNGTTIAVKRKTIVINDKSNLFRRVQPRKKQF